ncbi:MAG: catalase [Lachnospiraceae bacterium]|nr:catalase [Lachnospiraceae bacterium]
MFHPVKHFKTITHHRHLVRKHCFAVGLYRQGLMHDLSKYSPVEFLAGARYYQGNRSPNNAEREDRGVSYAWLHHKGRNKHHLEYWIDYDTAKDGKMAGMKMPVRYVVEMFCDRVAACKTYNGDKYKDSDPNDYYVKSHDHYMIHPESDALLRKMLVMLKNNGEEKTFRYIRKKIVKK